MRDRAVGLLSDASQADKVEPSYDAAYIRAEGERISPEHPLNAYKAENKEAVHYGSEHVLSPGHAGVKERKPRGHKHHQSSCHDEPCRITSVYLSRAFACNGHGCVQ